MSRAVLILFAVIVGSYELRAEGSAVTLLKGHDPAPSLFLVQEPYCPFGIGPCGGKCGEDGRKEWDCPADAIPCYQQGHCQCETASMCKPKKK